MESIVADGVRPDASMNSAEFPIVIRSRNWNMVDSPSGLYRTLEIPREPSLFTPANLGGGTEQTVRFCVEQQRPHELIDASKISTKKAATSIADLVRKHKIDILNVAGPRQSEWPEGYDYAFRALEVFVNSITSKSTSRSKKSDYS